MQQPARTKCEIYTRVMWYYRPVTQFNIWKKSEFYGRTYFTEQENQNPTTKIKSSTLFPTPILCTSDECKK